MKYRQIIVSVLVLIIFSFSSLALTIHSSHSSVSIVSSEDLERYVQTFVDSYNKELVDSFRSQFRKYFPFHTDYSYYVNATISDVHGAALEFTPWDQDIHESRTINTRVESAVFKYVDLGITSVANSTGYKVVIYTGSQSVDGLPFITIKSNAHVFFSNIIFVTNKASFAEVADGGELFLSDVIVDERYFHTLIMRGSNELSVWTNEQARNDAHLFFENHLYQAFNQSEEFREYMAYPELSQLLEQIIWKHLHAEETGYDLIAFKEDLANVRDLAREKYHVNTEFVDEILEYLEKIAMAPSSPPWWEVAPWSWVLGGIVGAIISIVLAVLRKRVQKSKKKRRSRKKPRVKRVLRRYVVVDSLRTKAFSKYSIHTIIPVVANQATMTS